MNPPKFKIDDHIQAIPTISPGNYYELKSGVIVGVENTYYIILSDSFTVLSQHKGGRIQNYNRSQIDTCCVLYDSPEGAFYRL